MSPGLPVGDAAPPPDGTLAVRDVRMVAFDLETTHPDPEEARIVTAAISVVGGGCEPQHYSVLVDPGVDIPDEAAEIHGVTTERARAEGTPIAEAVEEIVGALYLALQPREEDAGGVALVVYNARYDLTVADREARRHDTDPLQELAGELLVLDPLVIDKHYDRYRRGSRKLLDTCALYAVDLTDAHAADADALAAARLLWRMSRRIPVLGALDVREAHRLQVGWAREQAEGLADHFRRQGKPQHVEPAWPLIPHRPERTA